VKPAPAPVAPPPAQPSAKQKSDAELASRVKAALNAEPKIQGFAIDVTADDGKVSLFGTVGTKSRRDKAGQIAAHVSGVKSVVNNLAIVAGS
jgi:osmotically-inducible protein OsmY